MCGGSCASSEQVKEDLWQDLEVALLVRRKVHRRRASVSPEPKAPAGTATDGLQGDAAATGGDEAGTPQASPRGAPSEAEEAEMQGTPLDMEDGDTVSPLVSPRGERRRSSSRTGSRPASAGGSKIGRKRSRTDEILVKVAAEVEAEADAAGFLEASPQRFAEALARKSFDEENEAGISGSGLPVQRALEPELLQAAREVSQQQQQSAMSPREDGSSATGTPRDGWSSPGDERGAPSGLGAHAAEDLQPGSAPATPPKRDQPQPPRHNGEGAASAVVGDGEAEDAEGFGDGGYALPGQPGALSADERLARRQGKAHGVRDGVVLDEVDGNADALAQRRLSHQGASISVPDGVEVGLARQQLQQMQEQQRGKKAVDAARVDVHASAADKAALGQLTAAAEGTMPLSSG